MDKITTTFLFSVLFLFAACGQDVSRSPLKITPSVNPIVVEPGNPGDVSSPYGDPLGSGSFSVTVNRALVGLGGDETENHFALLRTLPGPNSPGAFYGMGLGNQAQVGFGLPASGLKVTTFKGLSFKVFESSLDQAECDSHIRLKILVNLNCDPLNPQYRVITTGQFIPVKKDEWRQFDVNPSDVAFSFAGTSGSARPLSKLLKDHPDSCFVAGDVFDLGMKRNQKLAPFQLIFGDRFYFEPSAVRIDDVALQIEGNLLLEDFES